VSTAVRAALVALAALALAPAAAPAATQWTVDKKASVRNYHGDFAIGYVYGAHKGPNAGHSAHVNEQARRGPWIYGSIDRHFGGWAGRSCGWVLVGNGNMHRNGRTVADGCPAPAPRDAASNPLAPRNIFTDGTYLYGTGGGTVIPARIASTPACVAAGGAFGYGNYNAGNGTYHNRYGLEANGRATRPDLPNDHPAGYVGFGIRYIAGSAALIKDARNRIGAPSWFFVRAACLQLTGPLFSSGLSVTGKRLRGMTVAFRGRTAKDLPYFVGTHRQALIATFSCGKPHKARFVGFHRATVTVGGKKRRVGVWKARFRIPARCRKAKRGTVAVMYAGNPRHKRAVAAARVKRG
jgi:hypothetical protein